MVLAVVTGVVSWLFACGADKNHAERDRVAAQTYPDAGYQGPDEDLDLYTTKYLQSPPPPCIDTCAPDPGSRPGVPQDQQLAECTQEEEGLEFLPLKIFDFDGYLERADTPIQTRPANEPSSAEVSAWDTYRYDDGSVNLSWPVNPQALATTAAGFNPRTTLTHVCGQPQRALHISGGPYTNWGGGIGRSLKCLNSGGTRWAGVTTGLEFQSQPWFLPLTEGPNPLTEIYCADPRFTSSDPAHFPPRIIPACKSTDPLLKSVCPLRERQYAESLTAGTAPPPDAFLVGQTLDLSQWDGLAVRARRGPDSQAGVRVLVGDKYVDEEMSFLQFKADPTAPRYCECVKECNCQGSYRPCTATTTSVKGTRTDLAPGATFCFDPARGDPPPLSISDYDPCQKTACNDLEAAYQVPDDRFINNSCSKWVSYTGRTEYLCYDAVTIGWRAFA
jgi:hypothetical protein